MATNKFNAKKVQFHDYVFDSKKEYFHYLKLLERVKKGDIHDLEVHPTYELKVEGQLVCKYIADFRYSNYKHNLDVEVVDIKGYKKGSAYAVFKLKAKLMKAIYNIDVVEI